MSKEQNIVCPFCWDKGFDLIGLKDHLTVGRCAIFNETIDVAEDTRLRRLARSDAP